ncbi:nitrous oxide reductase accessory protein NosL [Natrialbaceae archaeon A-arb3/5]
MESTITRRTVLTGTALAGVGILAGCLEDESDNGFSDPITIESGQACDNCTMEIVDYPGPVGQAFYSDPAAVLTGVDGDDPNSNEDDELDRPAQFCSSLCTYTFLFENQDDQEPEAVYLTDYSIADYEIDDGGDEPEISSHVDAEYFELATELTLVVGSEVEGAMGQSMIGFSDDDDASDFEAEHGGDRYEHDEVDQELVMSLM